MARTASAERSPVNSRDWRDGRASRGDTVPVCRDNAHRRPSESAGGRVEVGLARHAPRRRGLGAIAPVYRGDRDLDHQTARGAGRTAGRSRQARSTRCDAVFQAGSGVSHGACGPPPPSIGRCVPQAPRRPRLASGAARSRAPAAPGPRPQRPAAPPPSSPAGPSTARPFHRAAPPPRGPSTARPSLGISSKRLTSQASCVL
jgi:hypothetical protein